MTTLPEALARLAALGSIRSAWLPGMRTHHGERVIVRVSGGKILVQPDDIQHTLGVNIQTEGPVCVRADDGGPRRPDLSDPATAGLLPYLAREAYGEPTMHARPDGKVWCIERVTGIEYEWLHYSGRWGLCPGSSPIETPTEVEAWVAALIAKADALAKDPS